MKKNYFFRGIAVLLFSFLMFTNLSAQLYINEFLASNDAAYAGPQGDFPDWIEIYNAGDEAVMLGGYYMCDTLDVTVAFQIPSTYPDSVTVAAGGYIVFYANKGQESSVLNLGFKLSGDGEQIGLWNSDMELIEGFDYAEQTTDISYGRYPDGSDFWGFMPDVSPNSTNLKPEFPEVELFINEFMASNDVSVPGPEGDFPDWIEIYNAGDEDVMLGGFYMCDTLDINEAFQISLAYPDSVTVPAGGFIVFYANKGQETSVLNLGFKLSGDGEQIGLWNPVQDILDGYTYGEQITDTSYGRYADGTENWISMPDFSPGEPNRNTSSIGEINDNASISQNFPNPFSTKTNIEFTLEDNDNVTIKVFDIRGALVTVLTEDSYSAGTHMIVWDASEIPAGYYFYSLQTSKEVVTMKASIIR